MPGLGARRAWDLLDLGNMRHRLLLLASLLCAAALPALAQPAAKVSALPSDHELASPSARRSLLVEEPGEALLLLHLPKLQKPARGYPLVVVVPGLGCLPKDYSELSTLLLGRGYAVALFEHDGNDEYSAERWDERLAPAVEALLDESARPGSAIARAVDPRKLEILGHSLGGSVATLRAARDPRFKALAVFGPGGREDAFLNAAREVRAATLAIDGSLDRVTPPRENGGTVVDRADTPHKAHLIVDQGSHPNCPADFDADYIRDSGRYVLKPIPFWPFTTWDYEFPIVPGVKPMPGPAQRAVAFPYLAAWLDRFVAGRQLDDQRLALTDGRTAKQGVADGVLSEARFSPALAGAATPGLVGAIPD